MLNCRSVKKALCATLAFAMAFLKEHFLFLKVFSEMPFHNCLFLNKWKGNVGLDLGAVQFCFLLGVLKSGQKLSERDLGNGVFLVG